MRISIDTRHEEICNFQMYTGCQKDFQSLKDRFQSGPVPFPVDFITERLQVNISGINVRNEPTKRLWINIAGRYQDIIKMMAMRQSGYIMDILNVSKRFGIGIGNRWKVVL
jgi:hypothetical protein